MSKLEILLKRFNDDFQENFMIGLVFCLLIPFAVLTIPVTLPIYLVGKVVTWADRKFFYGPRV